MWSKKQRTKNVGQIAIPTAWLSSEPIRMASKGLKFCRLSHGQSCQITGQIRPCDMGPKYWQANYCMEHDRTIIIHDAGKRILHFLYPTSRLKIGFFFFPYSTYLYTCLHTLYIFTYAFYIFTYILHVFIHFTYLYRNENNPSKQHRSNQLILFQLGSKRSRSIDFELKDHLTIQSWSKKGNTLGIGTSKGSIILYDSKQDQSVPILGKHAKRICQLVWSRSNLLGLGSIDGLVTV